MFPISDGTHDSTLVVFHGAEDTRLTNVPSVTHLPGVSEIRCYDDNSVIACSNMWSLNQDRIQLSLPSTGVFGGFTFPGSGGFAFVFGASVTVEIKFSRGTPNFPTCEVVLLLNDVVIAAVPDDVWRVESTDISPLATIRVKIEPTDTLVIQETDVCLFALKSMEIWDDGTLTGK